MLSKGQKINDRYEIVKLIGEGGMANVYLAIDTILNRKVAIKVLRGDLAGDEKFIRRFQREAMSASNLSHPNIVEVYDVGEEDGNHYIVMEYIEGKTLKQLIQKRGALTVPEVIDIMTQLTDGIAHAHDAYIIHRDIKPQNILILDNGLVKITDFGIAVAINATQLTQTNSVMGSVHYLPPEQASGKGATIKSDIYSLGIVMYELLTGSVPFKGDNAVEIALKHMKEKIPSLRKQNPLIPQSIENIVLKATAKNPKNRYDNVREMYQDLSTALERENEKKYVFPYPETDMDDTKTMKNLKNSVKEAQAKEKNNEETEELAKQVETEDLKEKKSNKLLIGLAITLISLISIFAVIFLIIPSATKVEEIKIPDVSTLSVVDAEEELQKLGFEVSLETKKETSEKIEEGLVIGTEPIIGRKVKKGTTITLIVSSGNKYYEMEDFSTSEDKNYVEIKTILEEVHKLKVTIEKKDVEDKEKYKDKTDIIIGQSPAKGTKLIEGDNVTLYIPNIVEGYPDMVKEEWTVDDAKLFEEEYGIILDITYVETKDHKPGTVIEQKRQPGSVIIKGATLKISVAIEPKENSTEERTDIDENLLP